MGADLLILRSRLVLKGGLLCNLEKNGVISVLGRTIAASFRSISLASMLPSLAGATSLNAEWSSRNTEKGRGRCPPSSRRYVSTVDLSSLAKSAGTSIVSINRMTFTGGSELVPLALKPSNERICCLLPLRVA